MKPVILCVDDERVILDSLKREVKEIVGDTCIIELAENAIDALDFSQEYFRDGGEIPIVISDYIMPQMKGDELLAQIHKLSPMTKNILLTGQAAMAGVTNAVNHAALYRYIAKPWEPEDLTLTVKEALKSYRQEKDLHHRIDELEDERIKVKRERKVIDTLSKILSEKIEELEKQKGELEQVSKELNIATIEKILIEQEAEQMSRLLSTLQNSLKNNLFIRSVLHSLVNMLQVQLSIDKRENAIIEDLRQKLDARPGARTVDLKGSMDELLQMIFPRLVSQRKKTELNIHKSMTSYVKAVQRSLLGESVYFSSKPTNLLGIVGRVKQKYREILEDKKRDRPILFSIEPANPDVYLCVFDFALINIIENLLTNSIRKVIEANKPEMWIKLETFEEKFKNETYTVLRWADNGTGVEDSRKQSIFEGDSDKTEEGDHGVGLRDIKNTVGSVGGFIREVGKFSEGAEFLIGFPKVNKVEEIDFDKDFDRVEDLCFPPEYRDRKILVVDDDAEIAAGLKEFLVNAGIEKITVFTDGKQALDFLVQKKERPDVILTDFEMEPCGGISLIKKIRRTINGIPVLVISGVLFRDGQTDYLRMIELNKLGVKDIVTKPVDYHELFIKLGRILASIPSSKIKN